MYSPYVCGADMDQFGSLIRREAETVGMLDLYSIPMRVNAREDSAAFSERFRFYTLR
jgi:hypothetical protein